MEVQLWFKVKQVEMPTKVVADSFLGPALGQFLFEQKDILNIKLGDVDYLSQGGKRVVWYVIMFAGSTSPLRPSLTSSESLQMVLYADIKESKNLFPAYRNPCPYNILHKECPTMNCAYAHRSNLEMWFKSRIMSTNEAWKFIRTQNRLRRQPFGFC